MGKRGSKNGCWCICITKDQKQQKHSIMTILSGRPGIKIKSSLEIFPVEKIVMENEWKYK